MGRAQVHGNADPIALAAELRPLLAGNAGQAERDRRLPQENIDALEAANLFKLMTPRRWNGYGIPLATALSAHAELAKGCASTAWVTMIIGACTRPTREPSRDRVRPGRVLALKDRLVEREKIGGSDR
jgi:alkylation response protein AidB-like acyl-CoA dehydrogenase